MEQSTYIFLNLHVRSFLFRPLLRAATLEATVEHRHGKQDLNPTSQISPVDISTCGAYSATIVTKRIVVAPLTAVFRKEIYMRLYRLNGPVVFCTMLLVTLLYSASYGQDASCTYSVSPETLHFFDIFGGTAEAQVKASAPTCTFSARTEFPWITVSVRQEGSVGKVSVTVDGNETPIYRVGSVSIDGEEVTVIQNGPQPSGGD